MSYGVLALVLLPVLIMVYILLTTGRLERNATALEYDARYPSRWQRRATICMATIVLCFGFLYGDIVFQFGLAAGYDGLFWVLARLALVPFVLFLIWFLLMARYHGLSRMLWQSESR